MTAETLRPSNPNGGPVTQTAKRAAQLLRETLADGPAPVRVLKELAIQAGVGWRSLESAKADLGVQARKVGATWEWSLPGTATPQGNPAAATPQDRSARPQLNAAAARPQLNTAPDLHAQLRRIAEMGSAMLALAERLEASLVEQPVAPEPDPPKRALVDRRKIRRPGRWGAADLVRCGDCALLAEVGSDGQCATSGLAIRWPFARRRCPAFVSLKGPRSFEASGAAGRNLPAVP